jgi:hypothetical protein
MPRRRPINDDSLEHLISEVHRKLDGVAFNGGFESLVHDVQNIEKTQREMLSKMDEVHKVIYEPDDGLFARVKRVETVHDKEFSPLRVKIASMEEWKEELVAKDGPLAQAAKDSVQVAELTAWKKRIIGIVLGVAGSTGLMFVKMAYEFLKDHVSLR